jgi:hypothetical protein
MQQSYITQAAKPGFLRIFSGGQPNAANQSMRFDHGRTIATATGHCNFIVFNNEPRRESDPGVPIGRPRHARSADRKKALASSATPGHDAES